MKDVPRVRHLTKPSRAEPSQCVLPFPSIPQSPGGNRGKHGRRERVSPGIHGKREIAVRCGCVGRCDWLTTPPHSRLVREAARRDGRCFGCDSDSHSPRAAPAEEVMSFGVARIALRQDACQRLRDIAAIKGGGRCDQRMHVRHVLGPMPQHLEDDEVLDRDERNPGIGEVHPHGALDDRVVVGKDRDEDLDGDRPRMQRGEVPLTDRLDQLAVVPLEPLPPSRSRTRGGVAWPSRRQGCRGPASHVRAVGGHGHGTGDRAGNVGPGQTRRDACREAREISEGSQETGPPSGARTSRRREQPVACDPRAIGPSLAAG